MRVLIAPDKFKGTLNAIEVARAIELGVRKVLPGAHTILLPMADGGKGTVDAVVKAMNGRVVNCPATDPLGETVQAYFGLFPSPSFPEKNVAVIEMAAASGLHLIPAEKRNPLITTTHGTGELIRTALEHDLAEMIVGIGDSGTVDGGMGMAQALGVKFLDAKGLELGPGGRELTKIRKIDISSFDGGIHGIKVRVASDVENPLCGPDGAAHVYGPQKGATPQMVEVLEAGLKNYAQVIKRDLGKNISGIAGAGAAGGLGAGLIAFLDAELESGIELVMKLAGFSDKLKTADVVITGEGKIDAQTLFGKAPAGVAEMARKNNVPVYAICGQKGKGAEDMLNAGVARIFTISDRAKSLDDALDNAAWYVEQISQELARGL